MAGGRAVEHDELGRVVSPAAAARSSCLTLPSTRMSLIPGAAVATTSSAPGGDQAAGDPAHPVVLQVLEQGVVGGHGAGPDVGRAVGPAAAGQDRLGVGQGLGVAESAP